MIDLSRFPRAAISLLVAFVSVAAAQPATEASRSALAEGDRLWRLKHTRSALLAFEKVASTPGSATQAQAYARIGRIYLFKGAESEGAFPGWHEQVAFKGKALSAFDEALKRTPSLDEARVGRFKTLGALGRDPGPEPAVTPAPDGLLAAQIRELRAAKKYAEVIDQANAFATRFPDSELLPPVYDALIEAYAATPASSGDSIGSAIDKRIAAQPDPGAYVSGANLLISRGSLDQAARLAEGLGKAAEIFIDENLDSYKIAGKASGALGRTRATAADLAGWVLFLKGDVPGAEAKLKEAELLSRGQDFTNQFHMAELCRKKGEMKEARERYLGALSLTAGPEPQRGAARKALAQIEAGLGQDPAGFEAWLNADLDRRRDERRALSLRSMLDRPVPKLPLMALTGQPLDLSKLRGKVLLYKFFASW
jgi:tetratricopeptide (TPR) repeat protein